MCGRFTLHSRLNLLLQQFSLQAGLDWAPRYNIAPTQRVPIIRVSPVTGQREMVPARWGLVPTWAKDITIGNRLINARAESVASKPSFRSAFKRRRCLVPADGYFEWQKRPAGKQPYYIHRRDNLPFGFAGLWESWHEDQDDALETFTVITTDASPTAAAVHDRMPVIIEPRDYGAWLDPAASDHDALQSMLRPYNGDDLELDPVDKRVNSPTHDDPTCVEPLA
jgi:putative SOS response-associated peptidase YedK